MWQCYAANNNLNLLFKKKLDLSNAIQLKEIERIFIFFYIL